MPFPVTLYFVGMGMGSIYIPFGIAVLCFYLPVFFYQFSWCACSPSSCFLTYEKRVNNYNKNRPQMKIE